MFPGYKTISVCYYYCYELLCHIFHTLCGNTPVPVTSKRNTVQKQRYVIRKVLDFYFVLWVTGLKSGHRVRPSSQQKFDLVERFNSVPMLLKATNIKPQVEFEPATCWTARPTPSTQSLRSASFNFHSVLLYHFFHQDYVIYRV